MCALVTGVQTYSLPISSFDGRKIPAFYYRPAAPKQPGGKIPVLINIHGGPESQAQPSFSPVTEFYVRELGLAVLLPNVLDRQSVGQGQCVSALVDLGVSSHINKKQNTEIIIINE